MHCVDLIVAGWRAHEPYHYVSQPGNFSCGNVSFIHDPRQFTRNSHCVQQAEDSIITAPTEWKLENKGTFQYFAMYRECPFSFLVLFLLWHAIGWIKTSGTTTKLNTSCNTDMLFRGGGILKVSLQWNHTHNVEHIYFVRFMYNFHSVRFLHKFLHFHACSFMFSHFYYVP